MASWDELLERNRKYSETKHEPESYISELAQPPPSIFILSCIDFRVPVEQLLDIKTKDAFIIRNAGARVKSSFTDLLFIENFTQEQAVKNVIVIHHTDCGFTHNTDENVKNGLKEKAPHLAKEIDQLYFGTYGGSDLLEESVREDLKFLKASPLIRQEIKDNAKGYVYDIKSGKLNPVAYEG
ncbi:hypothetical protein G7Y89_g15455 [Cudoniella acicularis]|uniref:Carbonic anhydrase n=1 Tax=Cudoniella acicularis TaxID=354080 RepID=A0A8H4QN97_9HELO|nr:hypothetical protein G7Y89_g15455 [Cudoniella acicularis]